MCFLDVAAGLRGKGKKNVTHIPNKCPFKEDILKEMQAQQTALAALKEKQRADTKMRRAEKKVIWA